MTQAFSMNISPAVLAALADYFKVLSEPSRLQILACLSGGPMNGKEITEATGLAQANLSKHLKALTQTGIISRQPRGVSVYYTISDTTILQICELIGVRISIQMQEKAKEFEQFQVFTP